MGKMLLKILKSILQKHTNNSVHAITSKISPLHNSSGIEMLEAETFKLYCHQTLTGTCKLFEIWKYQLIFFHKIGTKFLLITAPQQTNVDAHMKKIYDAYSDFVMKNPFHTPEMPIRSDQFDQALLKFINTTGTA